MGDQKGESERPANNRPKLPLAQRRKARRLIVQALYQWLMAGTDPLDIRRQFKEETQGKIDWDYFNEVFLQVTSAVEELNGYLEPHLDRAVSALDPVEKALLYLGCFELARRIDIPYKVVINESVEMAKLFGATDSHKYVNGVLDKLVPSLRAIEAGR